MIELLESFPHNFNLLSLFYFLIFTFYYCPSFPFSLILPPIFLEKIGENFGRKQMFILMETRDYLKEQEFIILGHNISLSNTLPLYEEF
ncbi:hypothetical protein SAMN05660923_01414 [Tepidimicrobium xylanilyticum]|uniref:Uncharacterized protein n=1 Tax=Tepidimicrobium xylanilyticum TaxID=1123352 RepID=A0A1H2XDR3_9FIRM|nr:hypothetical protein SAMN05660923_01414 [Tepidimicrobium xylanilyticum]